VIAAAGLLNPMIACGGSLLRVFVGAEL